MNRSFAIAAPSTSLPRTYAVSDRWREWTTPHLTVDTDLPVDEAEPLIRDCERSLLAFDALVLPMVKRPTGRLRVVMFVQSTDYNAVGLPNSTGEFRPTAPDGEMEPAIYLTVERNEVATLIEFQHELTHRYEHEIPGAPWWLREGLCELFRSLRIGDKDVRVGAPLRAIDRFRIADLFATTAHSFRASDAGVAYRRADAFVSFLWFEQHEAMVRLVTLLLGGSDFHAAWIATFGSSLDELQSRFDRWYGETKLDSVKGLFPTDLFAWRAPPPTALETPHLLSAVEVLLLKVEALGVSDSASRSDEAFVLAKRAVEIDSSNAEAHYWFGVMARLKNEIETAQREFEAALALHPDDVRALAGLAWVRLQTRKRVDDFADVDPLVARIWKRTSLVAPLMTLAAYEHARGNDEAAFEYAQRAVHGSPDCVGCRVRLASLLNEMRRTDEAKQEMARAFELYPDGKPGMTELSYRAIDKVRNRLDGCAHDNAALCEELGNSYWSGDYVLPDRPRAVILWLRACDAGRLRSCVAVAWNLRNGQSIEADPVRSVELLRRACDGKVWDACNDLGDAFEKGSGVTADLKRAIELYQLACNHDAAWGCVSLAELAWRGSGLPRDEKKVVELLKRAAKLDSDVPQSLLRGCRREPAACSLAAVVWRDGISVKVDPEQALELFSTGCKRGDDKACASLSERKR